VSTRPCPYQRCGHKKAHHHPKEGREGGKEGGVEGDLRKGDITHGWEGWREGGREGGKEGTYLS